MEPNYPLDDRLPLAWWLVQFDKVSNEFVRHCKMCCGKPDLLFMTNRGPRCFECMVIEFDTHAEGLTVVRLHKGEMGAEWWS